MEVGRGLEQIAAVHALSIQQSFPDQSDKVRVAGCDLRHLQCFACGFRALAPEKVLHNIDGFVACRDVEPVA
jgi:hypothetical protein